MLVSRPGMHLGIVFSKLWTHRVDTSAVFIKMEDILLSIRWRTIINKKDNAK